MPAKIPASKNHQPTRPDAKTAQVKKKAAKPSAAVPALKLSALAAAARVLVRHVKMLGKVEKRLGLAVIRVRNLSVFELDDGRLAVDDVGDFGHIGSSFLVRCSSFWFVVRGS